MAMLNEVEVRNARLLMSKIGIPEKCALSAAIVFEKNGYGNLHDASLDKNTEYTMVAYLRFDAGIFYATFNKRGSLGVIRENNPKGKIVFCRVL